MAHLIDNKLLITVPSLVRPGMSSIMQKEAGKDKSEHKVAIVLPKGSFINGKDVSFYTLSINADELDPITPLPNTHCFYIANDRFIVLSRTITRTRKQGRPEQRIRKVRCQAFDLQQAIIRACCPQKPATDRRQYDKLPNPPTLLESLSQRAENAKSVSQFIGHRW